MVKLLVAVVFVALGCDRHSASAISEWVSEKDTTAKQTSRVCYNAQYADYQQCKAWAADQLIVGRSEKELKREVGGDDKELELGDINIDKEYDSAVYDVSSCNTIDVDLWEATISCMNAEKDWRYAMCNGCPPGTVVADARWEWGRWNRRCHCNQEF